MIRYMFKDLLPAWEKSTWIESWAMIGEVRELCEKNLSQEGELWRFIDLNGNRAERLPHGIEFYEDEDATRFRLVL